jgi:hypothetical protein
MDVRRICAVAAAVLAGPITLISELEAHPEPLYPQESRHGLSVARLIEEQVAFFVIRHDGEPAGCGSGHLDPLSVTDSATTPDEGLTHRSESASSLASR